MKTLKLILCLQVCLLIFANVQAQTSQFNLAEYQQFLSQHQNMTSAQLLEMHPAGNFCKTAEVSWESARYHDLIDNTYQLTDFEKSLLDKHGFVVTERLSKRTFAEQFIDVWQKDLPVFISADAILHAFHYQYDLILRNIEYGIQYRLIQLLGQMHDKIPELAAKYSNNTELERMFRDVDVYVTVPLKLLEQKITPNYQANEIEINQILALINAEQLNVYPFFSDHGKVIDFSQFKPRGHYAKDIGEGSSLSNYFRAMMWLGRIEIYLLPPKAAPSSPPQTMADIQRQIIDAVLIAELMDLANVHTIYDEIEAVLSFFVGEQDNVTPDNLNLLTQSINLTDASQLLDTLAVKEFQDSLKTKGFAFQRIVSQILKHDPNSPGSVEPASAFMLFGQRFVIDSYVTNSVVYDHIKYNGDFPRRLFPSTLDVLFALGNDAAAQLLIPGLDEFHYSSNLAALRYLVNSYDAGFWNSSLYNLWLNSIRALNPHTNREELPSFMQTGAWWQQKMNTQLASWTELRHDNLLYAKQSYTIIPVCSYPCGYVEPVPEFFQRMKTLAENATTKLGTFMPGNNSVIDYFSLLHGVCDTLGIIAEKELQGIALDDKEESFIKAAAFEEGWCGGNVAYGWFIRLCYFNFGDNITGEYYLRKDHLVADYHTTPADCAGNIVGWVSHAGTGKIDLAIVTAKDAAGQLTAYAGPVSSYHEYVTTNFQRLTDKEWQTTFLAASLRPNWINLYLADSLGQSKGAGATLFTGVKGNSRDEAALPATHLIAQNYPNPFNASTIIRFLIPYQLAKSFTELTVYNIQGRVVKQLLNRELAAGNYFTKWDGTDDSGEMVASGLYFYKLQVGSHQFVGRMQLVK